MAPPSATRRSSSTSWTPSPRSARPSRRPDAAAQKPAARQVRSSQPLADDVDISLGWVGPPPAGVPGPDASPHVSRLIVASMLDCVQPSHLAVEVAPEDAPVVIGVERGRVARDPTLAPAVVRPADLEQPERVAVVPDRRLVPPGLHHRHGPQQAGIEPPLVRSPLNDLVRRATEPPVDEAGVRHVAAVVPPRQLRVARHAVVGGPVVGARLPRRSVDPLRRLGARQRAPADRLGQRLPGAGRRGRARQREERGGS